MLEESVVTLILVSVSDMVSGFIIDDCVVNVASCVEPWVRVVAEGKMSVNWVNDEEVNVLVEGVFSVIDEVLKSSVADWVDCVGDMVDLVVSGTTLVVTE